MFKLSFTIALIILAFAGLAQSPHGEGFKTDCMVCHTSLNWKVSRPTMSFDHNTTTFKLTGQHQLANCKSCHQSLKFQEAKSECKDCHTDMHRNTLGPDCARCHDTRSWIIQNTSAMHQLSRFPLLGNHAVADCASCHKSSSNLQFEPLSVECYNCHKAEYLATTAPNHLKSGYPTNCEECHGVSVTNWTRTNFDHGIFPLTGGHNIACVDCHKGGTYQKISSECISCHQSQFTNAKGHVASKFSTDCRTCHNSNNWLGATFDHSQTTFPLTGAHVSVTCALCHTTGYAGTSAECNSCHQKNYTNAQAPGHTKAGISADCKSCHSPDAWQPSSFNHSNTGFELTGGHAVVVQCSDCHLGNTTSAKPECISCHQVQYNNAKGHVASKFPTDCKMCHTSANWIQTTFNHTQTNFPLTGAHATTECASCHAAGYVGTSTECNSCHKTNYTNAQAPSHTKAGIPVDCKTCHTTTAWQPSTFNHGTTVFPLTGAHAAIVQCSDCHLGSTTIAKPDCYSCHQVQYDGAKGHLASKFPTDCKICHNMNNWLGAVFNHNSTSFPLTGAHTTIDCALCHTSGYAGTSAECNSCHKANYTNAQAPSHTKAGIPVDCKTCHTTTVWQPSTFNHGTTIFPLTSAHAAIAQCSDCHLGSTTIAKPDCYSCHQVQYDGAKGHLASKFPTDCKICHNMNNWLGAVFNHNSTSFPLTGAHTTVDCALCHTMGYAGTSAECNSCHKTNYTNAQAPSHIKAGIPVDCKTCHTTTAWQPSSFNHGTTIFPLTGAHAAIAQCSDCHLGSTTIAKPDCYSCHQVQYDGAKGHLASKFPTDCKICHNMNNWLGAIFDHNTTTFPLTGAHAKVDCSLCHTTGYAGTSAECNSCHQANYTNAQVPSHTKAGIPVDCKTCHSTTVWQPSTFNHGTTIFPLAGAHAAIAQCSDCHLGSTTIAKPDCYSCHQVQYDGAKGHLASKFPTDCKICHNMNNWLGVTFNHSTTLFPLTGAHVSVDCASCHSTGYIGISTACSSCHTTDYNQTTNPNHKTLSLSLTCTDCHTTITGWQPASFPVHSNYYPLTGAHAAIKDCAACHKGVYTNTPNTCYACHTTDYNNTTNPAHKTAQYSTDCTSCHTNKAWIPSTFNHTSYFPIASGRHVFSCATCHTTPTNYAIFTCITASCHANAHNRSQGSAGCYRCHPQGKAD